MTTIAAKTYTASDPHPDGVVSLWASRVHPETINELRWFYQSSAAAMGHKSAFGAVVSRIYGQSKTTAGAPKTDDGEHHVESAARTYATPWDRDDQGDDPEDQMIRRIDDTAKHRRIRHGLGALTTPQLAALDAVYEPRNWPNALLQTFGELAGLAVISEAALDAYAHADDTHARGVRWWLNERCRHGKGSEDGLVADVLKEIEAVALDAHQVYSANREASRGR